MRGCVCTLRIVLSDKMLRRISTTSSSSSSSSISNLKREVGETQMMNKMELPMSILVSATSREEIVPDDDSDLQAAAFRSLRVVTMVVTVTTTIITPGIPTPYTMESK